MNATPCNVAHLGKSMTGKRMTASHQLTRSRRGSRTVGMGSQAHSLTGFGEAFVSESGLADPPRAARPQPEPVEVEIDDGGCVEGQELAHQQPADDRKPERAAQFGTLAKADCQ